MLQCIKEARGYQNNSYPSDSTVRVTAYRFGPRICAFENHHAFMFREILAGGTRITGEERVRSGSSSILAQDHVNGFSAAASGGIDVRINSWLNWRSLVDYSYLHVIGLDSNGVRAGSGIAFRFGH
jgi:hypothetical protein